MGRYAFLVPPEKREEVDSWIKEQDLAACYLQLNHGSLPDYELARIRDSIEKGIPDPCCKFVQGKITYSFIPTALGDVTKIKHNITGVEIDITPYDFW